MLSKSDSWLCPGLGCRFGPLSQKNQDGTNRKNKIIEKNEGSEMGYTNDKKMLKKIE